MLTEFTTRDLSILGWIIGLFIIGLFFKRSRNVILKFWSNLIAKPFLWNYTIIFLGILISAFILNILGFWECYMHKYVVYWGISTLLPLGYRMFKRGDYTRFWSQLIISNISILSIVSFVLNIKTAPFWIEFIFQPAILAVTLIYLNIEELHRAKYRFLCFTLQLILLVWNIKILVDSFHSFDSMYIIKLFMLPILLTLLNVPTIFIFITRPYYMSIFKSLKTSHYSSIKMTLYLICNIKFDIYKLKEFHTKKYPVYSEIKDFDTFKKLVRRFNYWYDGRQEAIEVKHSKNYATICKYTMFVAIITFVLINFPYKLFDNDILLFVAKYIRIADLNYCLLFLAVLSMFSYMIIKSISLGKHTQVTELKKVILTELLCHISHQKALIEKSTGIPIASSTSVYAIYILPAINIYQSSKALMNDYNHVLTLEQETALLNVLQKSKDFIEMHFNKIGSLHTASFQDFDEIFEKSKDNWDKNLSFEDKLNQKLDRYIHSIDLFSDSIKQN